MCVCGRINIPASFMGVSHLIQTVNHTSCLITLEGNLKSKIPKG